MQVKNKIAIITGASSGIGLATAKLLAEKGVKLALVARSKDKLESLSKELLYSLAIPTDMTKEAEVKKMVRRVTRYFGRIDILINSAGQGYDAPIEKINPKTFRQLFRLDIVGPLVAMQQVIPQMRRQNEGAIVNISSGTALMHLPNMSAYSSLKLALAQISLTAREELKKDNIVVGVVYPYITLTDFEKNTIKDFGEIVQPEENGGPFHPPDTAEYVAEKVLEAIESGEPEIFCHDWMKKLA